MGGKEQKEKWQLSAYRPLSDYALITTQQCLSHMYFVSQFLYCCKRHSRPSPCTDVIVSLQCFNVEMH